jgi:FSR family fosmidomycin resistance protein-like MFS transporter
MQCGEKAGSRSLAGRVFTMTDGPENAGRSHAEKIKIFIVSSGHLWHDIYTSFLSPLLPLLIEKLSFSYVAAGFLSVLMRLPSILSPLVGAWSDRYSLHYCFIATPAITAIAMCLMGNAPNYYSIAALTVIAGASSTFFHVPAPVLLKRVAGKRLGSAMSLFQVGGELSRTIGPLVLLSAVSWWTLEGIYRLIPLGVGMSLLLHRTFRNLPPVRSPNQRFTDSDRIKDAFCSAKPFFISVFGILLCKSFSASVVAAFLPVYLTAQGKSLWFAGGALSLLQGAALAGVFITGTLSDKIGCNHMLLFLTAATPLAMLLFICSSGWLLIVSLVLLGLTAFASTPVILSLIQQRCHAFPATANGIYMMVNFMLGSLTVLLAGMLSDVLGIAEAMKLCAACSWLGLPFLCFLDRKKCS